MKLYKSDKIRFVAGVIIIFLIYTSFYVFIRDNKDVALIPRKLRHIITLLFTLAIYFVGTFHLGRLKALWMSKLWHIVHISGLCIITVIGLFDWLFIEGKPILALSRFARTVQELLISPLLYLAMGLLNRSLKNAS